MAHNLTKPEYRVRVVWDDDADLSWAEFDAETLAKIQDGTYGVYGVIAEIACPCCGAWSRTESLWGCVVDATETGTYAYAAAVPDEYLRSVAVELVSMARAA